MSLNHVQELARQFGDAVTSMAVGEAAAERAHYEAMLEGIKTMATALTLLVHHLAQPVSGVNPAWGWTGVYLPSCGGYLLASGKIFLPPLSGEADVWRDLRDPTYTVIEILDRRTKKTLDTREAEMHGLFTSLKTELNHALNEVEKRKKSRESVGRGIAEDLKAVTTR